METRRELKGAAKRALRDHGYLNPLFATLFATSFALLFAGFRYTIPEAANQVWIFYLPTILSLFVDNAPVLLITTKGIALAAVGFWIVYKLLIGNPLSVGLSRYYMEHRGANIPIYRVFTVLDRGYLRIVKTMLFTKLMVFLWSLVFLIPGICKLYSYSMVQYILAENPRLTTGRVLELSEAMTRDCRFKIFLLEMSFLGWILLGVLCLNVGGAFVNPYIHATIAELYASRREDVLGRGLATPEELPGWDTTSQQCEASQ